MTALDPAWVGLFAAIFGGVGIKIIEHWLGRSKDNADVAGKLREELRIDLTTQREEIKQLEAEVEHWRGAYYTLRDSLVQTRTEYQIEIDGLRRQLDAAKVIDTTKE